MSATLLAAVNDAWNGNAALLAVLTLYNDEPPEGTALPYAVINRLREDASWANFEGGKDYEGRLLISIYGTGTATVEGYVAQAKAVMEANGAIAIDNRETLGVLMEIYEVRLDSMRSTAARRVTEGTMHLFVWSHG